MELNVYAITGDKKFKAGFRIINEIWVFRVYGLEQSKLVKFKYIL